MRWPRFQKTVWIRVVVGWLANGIARMLLSGCLRNNCTTSLVIGNTAWELFIQSSPQLFHILLLSCFRSNIQIYGIKILRSASAITLSLSVSVSSVYSLEPATSSLTAAQDS